MRVGFANFPLFFITSPGPRIGAEVGEVIANNGDDKEFVGISCIASVSYEKETKLFYLMLNKVSVW